MNTLFSRKLLYLLNKRALLHFTFWTILVSFFSLGFFSKETNFIYFLWNFIGVLFSYFFLVYGSLFLFELLIVKKRSYFLFVIFLGITIFLVSYSNAYIYNHTNPGSQVNTINFIAFIAFLSLLALSLKISRSLFLQLQKEIDEKTSLIYQKDYFLRSQIHPHFLFNTLNNLYGLSILKSEKLPELMLLLSDVLRYQINTVNDTFVPLVDEIVYLNKYIELEKIRYGNELQANFLYTENINREIKIAPGLLIVFIENAFTHTKSSKEKNYNISINLNIEKDIINFTAQNPSSTTNKDSTGMGIKNATSRLQLIYTDEYFLDIQNQNDTFTVHLKLPVRK